MKNKRIVPVLMLGLAMLCVFSAPAQACGGGMSDSDKKAAAVAGE